MVSFSPGGGRPCFHKMGGNFSRRKFPAKFPGKMSRQFFPEKFFLQSFPGKYYDTNFAKVGFTDCNQLYRYKLLVMLWWKFVVKISRRENFGKFGKLPDGKISPPGFSPIFSGILWKPLCKPVWKSCGGRLSGKFLPEFLRYFRRKCWENFFCGKFLTKVSSEIIVSSTL